MSEAAAITLRVYVMTFAIRRELDKVPLGRLSLVFFSLLCLYIVLGLEDCASCYFSFLGLVSRPGGVIGTAF